MTRRRENIFRSAGACCSLEILHVCRLVYVYMYMYNIRKKVGNLQTGCRPYEDKVELLEEEKDVVEEKEKVVEEELVEGKEED